ncbi:MAG: S-layer homology domain-containing protein, partial [Clostridiales bacterium]|nr:S-layer homology domain-containing protein [Clostridiales bacterium]
LSALQQEDGGYQNQGQGMSMTGGPESIAQAIVALTALGIDPLDESTGFVKPGGDLISALLRYYLEDGCFNHEVGGNANGMATEQGAYALVAYDRFVGGANRLYDMSDAAKLVSEDVEPAPVDKAVLENEIDRAEALHEADYTAASWADMASKLSAAKQVFADPDAAQDEVNAAKNALSNAIGALQRVTTSSEPKSTAYISVKDVNAKSGQKEIFFAGDSFEIEQGQTAYDLLVMTGLALRTSGHPDYGLYVEAIDGFGEFDDGPGSGWMYKVNGAFPEYSSQLFTLRDGDIVEWLYTRDYGADLGKDMSGYTDGDNEEDEDTTPGTTPGATPGGPGGGGLPGSSGAPVNGGAATAAIPGLVSILDGQTPLSGFPGWANPFTDIKHDDWYYDAVAFAQTSGLMVGTGEGEFSPDTNLSRAMLVTMLWRLEAEPETEGMAFTDVAGDQWYAKAIAWASAKGVVSGYGGGLFGPNDQITREQLAAILLNYAKYKELAIADNTYETASYKASYDDAGSVSGWAAQSMKWANNLGLINGRTETTLAPLGTATRAETAAILQRFIQKVAAA